MRHLLRLAVIITQLTFSIDISKASSLTEDEFAKARGIPRTARPLGILQLNIDQQADPIQTAKSWVPPYFDGQRLTWKDGVVVYNISESLTEDERLKVAKAMLEITDVSCVTFRAVTNASEPHVQITNTDSGCYASLAYLADLFPEATMVLNLESGYCFFTNVIIHEFFHVLGAFHEQARPDRNQHVKVLWDNIINSTSTHSQFLRTFDEEADPLSRGPVCNLEEAPPYDDCHLGFGSLTFGSCYDYGSIMHYHPFSFSRNGEPTIVPVNPNIPLTALGGLQMTPYDIYELNSAYDCPRNLRLPTRCPFDHLPQFLLAKPRASLTPEKPCISIQSPDHPETTYTDKDIVLSYDFQVGDPTLCSSVSVTFLEFSMTYSFRCRMGKMTLIDGGKPRRTKYCGYELPNGRKPLLLRRQFGTVKLEAKAYTRLRFRADICANCNS